MNPRNKLEGYWRWCRFDWQYIKNNCTGKTNKFSKIRQQQTKQTKKNTENYTIVCYEIKPTILCFDFTLRALLICCSSGGLVQSAIIYISLFFSCINFNCMSINRSLKFLKNVQYLDNQMVISFVQELYHGYSLFQMCKLLS